MNKASFLYVLLLAAPMAFGQIIEVVALEQRPMLDAQESGWRSVPGHFIPVKPINTATDLPEREVVLKAGHFNGEVFFFLKWADQTHDVVHKPWIWDEKKQRYVRGKEREDRLAIQFEMEGEYSTDWANAKDFKADMWHWKSSRSNPIGFAQDQLTVVSKNKLLRAAPIPSAKGGKRYVLRQSDSGKPLYRSLRYAAKQQEVMPKYELLEPQGSIADIKAHGVWRSGYWQLALSRQLNTGNDDDIQFSLGRSIRGGVAVFDATENDQHLVSETLLFKF